MAMLIEQLLAFIEGLGAWGYLIGFVAALVEALAFIGVLVPGAIIILFLGFLASKGQLDPLILVLVCSIGATLGDTISFYLGRNGSPIFSRTNRIFNTKYLVRGRDYFKRHGHYSVFLGRFIGAIRAFIPYVAGVFRMDTQSFFVWNISSAIAWSVVHVFAGYFFGAAWKVARVWSERAGLFLIVSVMFLVAMWYIARFVARRSKRTVRFLKSIWSSIVGAVAINDDVLAWIDKHPRMVRFLGQRMTPNSFWGLPFTLLAIAFLYALLELFGIVQQIATTNVVASADIRIENLLYEFRSAPATIFFLWVTMLGSWKIALVSLVCSSVVLFVWRKDRFIIPLWMVVLGSQLMGVIGKYELHRPRPEGVAIYTEQSFSFPSGHSIFAVALYGFLTYVAARYARRWRSKIYTIFFGLTVIFLVGLSRLYVGVHYFSDVWGGYLVGALWLVIGINLAEWLSYAVTKHPSVARVQSHASAIFITIITIAVFVAYFIFMGHATITTILSSPPSFQAESIATNSALSIFVDGAPRYTETLGGNQQEPVSFIVTAPSEQVFVEAFRRAGWHIAEQITSKSLVRLIGAAITGKPYPTAPITPSFWNEEVNDFAFEKPTEKDNIRERHHARFWRTPYITDSGDRVYVGTASLDLRIKWFVTHAIDPNIDEERAILLEDLQRNNMNMTHTSVQFVKPVLGKNFTGDMFFTDGKAHVIELK